MERSLVQWGDEERTPEETEQLNPLGIAIAGFKIQADNACNARSLVFGTRKLPVIGSYYYEK